MGHTPRRDNAGRGRHNRAMLRLLFSACLTALVGCTTCDIHIKGGLVLDGTGAAPRQADVLIRGGEILAVGSTGWVRASTTIDARGKFVTPGFIDAHAHGDVRRTPSFRNFTAMGVTTICLGQDGVSPGGGAFDTWLETARKGKPALNVAPFVGHGTLRKLAGIGMETQPEDAALERLEALVAAAMEAGAFGVTFGLEYEPGRFAEPAEIARVCAAVAADGGVAMAHLRSEDDDAIWPALREFVSACPIGGRAHVSHLKVVYGTGAARARRVLEWLDGLRQTGRTVTADIYPYVASYTGIGIVFPPWAKPPHDYVEVLAGRRDELAAFLRKRVEQRNGPGAILLGSGEHAGRTLAEVAASAGQSFEDVLIDMGPRGGGAAHFVMDEELMQTLLSADHVVIGSDGSPTMRHPRGHGTFARVIDAFSDSMGLARTVHKMTGLTAEIVGLEDRGLLAPGMAADVLVFDPGAVRDRATFEQPFERAEGFDTVIIGGELVRHDGEFTDARPGRILLRR